MRALALRAVVALTPLVLIGCGTAGAGSNDGPPRLIVVLVVDQMRADYLERYADLFDGGFARILREGAMFANAFQDHAATVTAVGHAAISTGVFPARSGIVGNHFFDRAERRFVYSAFDPQAPILDFPDAAGRSPRRLLRTTLADWLREAHPGSRVFSIALKDRSAIMMGGHAPDGAYWYHEPGEAIVTSGYYGSEVPDWLRTFGAGDRIASTDTPMADEAILRLAQTAVAAEKLGLDDIPDLLFIGASAADYIGHRWGPYSREVRDYYVELDRYLGVLFDHLDRRIGLDRWAFVLTGDHGAAQAPEEVARRGEDARRISDQEFARAFRSALDAAYRDSGFEPVPTIEWLAGPHILTESATPDELRAFRRAIADRFAEIDFVAAAYTADEVGAADASGGAMIHRFRRSFDPERSPDVVFALEPNYVVGGAAGSHGSAYPYDMHVPLVFMGPGIRPGVHRARARTVDIAPSLARLLGIAAPADLDGRTLPGLTP